MGKPPLDDPRLSEIEAKLNSANFEDAQRLLAALGDVPGSQAASVYFATRLLFQRGKLDSPGVVARLRELLGQVGEFPEAARMLKAAERGTLDPSPEGFRRATMDPGPALAERERTRLEVRGAPIPRAPALPHFAPHTGIPSYVPRPPQPPATGGGAMSEAPLHRAASLSPPPAPPAQAVESAPRAAPPPSSGRGATAPRQGGRSDIKQDFPSIPPLDMPGVSSSHPPFGLEARSNLDTVRSPAPPNAARAQPSESGALPSLADIAQALESGRPARALELAERASGQPAAELTLLKARAQAALGQLPRAESELGRLLRAPLLEPSTRSAAARLLIELGAPTRALEQARRAFEEDPDDPLVRVTCAWALIRVSRHTQDASLLKDAEPLLPTARARDVSLVALLPALRAALAAEQGDPARALSLAQSALSHDARQPDALAAIALASARLGLTSDAERAWRRLEAVARVEARALSRRLAQFSVQVGSAAPAGRASEAQLVSLWGQAETALVRGRRDFAIAEFEQSCIHQLQTLTRRAGDEPWGSLAAVAARLFTQLPVLRHFAPYDSSVFSVERLAAALDLLYGSEAHPNTGDAVVQLAGAYVGESLRQAFGGDWSGSLALPAAASVEAIGLSVRPCERVSQRIRHGEPLSIAPPSRLHPGADPLGNSVPLSMVPPCPWDPAPWPASGELPTLGRLLPESVVGLYCALQADLPLDHSVAGAVAIDRYIALLAPPKAPPDPEAGWIRRASVLLGAYLGEVLVDAVGARWQELSAEGPQSYRLLLRDGSSANPVTRVFDRLSGRRVSPLSEYVARLAGGRPSLGA